MAAPIDRFWPRLRELECDGLSRDEKEDDYSEPNNPPLALSPFEVSKIERKLGTTLPHDYRQFLLEVGGVLFHSTKVSPVEASEWGPVNAVNCLYGSEKEKGSLLETFGLYQGELPEGLIPIGEDPAGNLFCLGIGGQQLGKVYFWDQDRAHITLVANSFADFINRLIKDDE
jgi:cell wall assembly regulator SMI1